MSNVVAAPPLTITDLAVTIHCTSMDLTWTAPGSGCAIGVASSYDLRRSQSGITAANFSAAEQNATRKPSAPRTPEVMNLDLGACSGRWYYAIRALDVNGNASGISNDPSGSTPCHNCIDGLRPAIDLSLALAAPTPSPARSDATIRFTVPLANASQPFELAV